MHCVVFLAAHHRLSWSQTMLRFHHARKHPFCKPFNPTFCGVCLHRGWGRSSKCRFA